MNPLERRLRGLEMTAGTAPELPIVFVRFVDGARNLAPVKAARVGDQRWRRLDHEDEAGFLARVEVAAVAAGGAFNPVIFCNIGSDLSTSSAGA